MRDKNIFSKGLLVLLLLIAIDYLPLLAQKESQTKVTIIKESYDEQGNKTVEKIVKEGAEADAIDLDQLGSGNSFQRSFEFKTFDDLKDMEGFGDFTPFGGQGMDQFKSFFDSLGFNDFEFFSDNFGNEGWQPFGQMDAIKPKLGIKISDLESEAGVLVTHVLENTPADRAGIKEGDVILALDDKQITSSQELVNHIQALKAEDVVSIDLRRNEQHLIVEAKLTEYRPKKEIEIRKI